MKKAPVFLFVLMIWAGPMCSISFPGEAPGGALGAADLLGTVRASDAVVETARTVYPADSGQGAGLIQGWSPWASAPFNVMDNAVTAYHGKIYAIGGFGADGRVGIYDTLRDSWTEGAVEPSPAIPSPMDGCFGVNARGEPVVVLFPDTSGIAYGEVHRYNIATDSWDIIPTPPGFPPNGQWAQRIISMRRFTESNVCYISGGATGAGGGNLSTLWRYHPSSNTITNLGNFTHHPVGFNFHAAWFAPWVGSRGGICIAGGADASPAVIPDTQCYDIASGIFLPPNATLPPMPEGIWGAAALWTIEEEKNDYQLWLVNGITSSFTTWGKSMYYSSQAGEWFYGPPPAQIAFRTAGATDTLFQSMHVIGGSTSTSSSTPSSSHQVMVPWITDKPRLLRPNGGTYTSGSATPIEWGAPSTAVKHKLYYSINNGVTWKTIVEDCGDRRYDWEILAPAGNKTKCRVRVVSYNSSGRKVGSSRSLTPFTIEVVRVTFPNGDETLSSGGPVTITWEAHDTIRPVVRVDLHYSTDGGSTWKLIGSTENTGSFSWETPVPSGAKKKTKCKVRVTLLDSKGISVGKDTSDGVFTLQP